MTPDCQNIIKRDEGYAKALPDGGCEAYPDVLTGGAPWTIAWGLTGPGIGSGTIWTLSQAEAEFSQRFSQMLTELDHSIPWWRHLSDVRQDVICNMTWNLGIQRLLGFVHFLQDLQMENYQMAANEMLASHWAAQVKGRAQRLALAMRTGISQSIH